MKGKLFLSDEGYGHIVRQSAIMEEIRMQLSGGLELEVQTHRHLEFARKVIVADKYTDCFNNIVWQKTTDGTPDIDAIHSYYEDYVRISEEYIDSNSVSPELDFVLSDFVYEAFPLAAAQNVPAFGVAHFTWDWFFSKLYPPAISRKVIRRMMSMAEQSKMLFFPYFTSREIHGHFRSKAIEVPLIIRKKEIVDSTGESDKVKVLLIDSGSGVNRTSMLEIADKILRESEFHFYVSESVGKRAGNVSLIPSGTLLVDYIAHVDLVVGRAGFNTISECIAYRTPMLLFGENLNPEMKENAIFVKEEGLGSFTSLRALKEDPGRVLNDFLSGEYNVVKRNMQDHDFRTDGARVVADYILNYLSDAGYSI